MKAATPVSSCITYRVTCEGYFIGEGQDRDEAEEIRDGHANRNRRNPLTDYAIEVVLREEAE